MTRTFDTDWLRSVIYKDTTEAEIIINDIHGNSRWTIEYKLVFKFEDKFYQAYYSEGATENQDREPFEDEDEYVCTEVFPREETVIVYKP